MFNLITNTTIDRRMLLRGLGASMALPFLDAMIPARAASGSATLPRRFAWIYIPNGVVQDAWHPEVAGADWEATPSLSPLTGVKQHINVFTGLDREFRGGTGVHAQAGCCWLTSSPPSEALDGGFPTNISLDQIIARRSAGDTLLPSLELSCNDHINQKETKYFESLAWYGPGYAANVVKNPAEVYSRLFDKPDPATRSVLDVILEDARRLERTLGPADREKLGEYLESVRSVEKRIEKADAIASSRRAEPGTSTRLNRPRGIPEDRGAYIRLMGDLMAIAFQQDLTRVATLLIDPERWDTPRMYHGLFDAPQNHHVLTHTRGDEAKETLQKIDRFHVEQFAYLVKRMANIKEGGGSLLDNSLISFGSGMGDGRVHDYNNLPLITAGSAGGLLKTGSHYKYDGKVPLANVWLTLLNSLGEEREGFADSTGTLSELAADARDTTATTPLPAGVAAQQKLAAELGAKVQRFEMWKDEAGNVTGMVFINHQALTKTAGPKPGIKDDDLLRLRELPHLTAVNFEGQPIGDRGLAVLKEFSGLKQAGFHYMKKAAGSSVSADFISVIDGMHDLEILEIKHNFKVDAINVDKLEGPFPKMWRLVLDTPLTAGQTMHLIRLCPNVTDLQLHRTAVSPDQLATIGRLLPKLEVLWFKPRRLKSEHLAALGQFQSLRIFSPQQFRDVLPFNEGWEFLAEVPKLERLEIENRQQTSNRAGLDQLKSANPKLVIDSKLTRSRNYDGL